MLRTLFIEGIGPVSPLTADFAPRINIITGDNGLGKSFFLDVCLWALTGRWPVSNVVNPDPACTAPKMKVSTTTSVRHGGFDFDCDGWFDDGAPPTPKDALVITAAVNGDFLTWDPHRTGGGSKERGVSVAEPLHLHASGQAEYDDSPGFGSGLPVFRDIANGHGTPARMVCNGLIADWSNWYLESRGSEFAGSPFPILDAVVSLLSHPTEPIRCGPPTRIYPDDSRRFPTLIMPYGSVAYPHWSAGVKRIVHLAYMLVWAWVEHQASARLRRLEPTRHLVLLIDEVESHLHPRWQRSILPAILKVAELLSPDLKIQVIATTHSPLVLASLEPDFNEEQDQLFCFNFDPKAPREQMVTFDALPWVNHGDAVGWLTSDVFGLTQARSTEAEIAIEAAEAFARGELDALPPNLKTREAITRELQRVLGSMDRFWPRWIARVQK